RGLGARYDLPGHLCPAKREVIGHVCDRGAPYERDRVVPAVGAARRVLARVEAVALERRQVDAADERELTVDDHELLVMAVHRPLPGVECVADARAAGE